MTNGKGYSVRDLMDQHSDSSFTEGPGDGELLERFIGHHDESAFSALVRRHGPMVLGVCRRVLNDWQRAEDAFQVTFLVLARKAESLTRPELLANWLHGVAYRIALKARSQAARQRAHERQAATMLPMESQSSESAQELREVLDKELDRLPEKYRAPLVLCYLEGRTNEEAARLLNCPIGSMSNRLARGRGLLRARLTRYGLVFDLRFCSRFLAQHELPPTTVPPELEALTIQSALAYIHESEHSTTHELPVPVAQLIEDVLGSLDARRPYRLLLVLAALIVAAGLASLVWWLW